MKKIERLRKKYQPDESKELKPIFNRYVNKRNWKRPFTATVNTEKEAKKLARAIEWFHASKPKIEIIPMLTKHKEGLVWMKGKSKYRVISSGYAAY